MFRKFRTVLAAAAFIVATYAAAAEMSGSHPDTYVVKRGDTLSRIARTYQVAVADLLSWNKLPSANALKPGQRLVMYIEDRRLGG